MLLRHRTFLREISRLPLERSSALAWSSPWLPSQLTSFGPRDSFWTPSSVASTSWSVDGLVQGIGILKGLLCAKRRPYSLTRVDYEFEREHTGAFWASRKVLKKSPGGQSHQIGEWIPQLSDEPLTEPLPCLPHHCIQTWLMVWIPIPLHQSPIPACYASACPPTRPPKIGCRLLPRWITWWV